MISTKQCNLYLVYWQRNNTVTIGHGLGTNRAAQTLGQRPLTNLESFLLCERKMIKHFSLKLKD